MSDEILYRRSNISSEDFAYKKALMIAQQAQGKILGEGVLEQAAQLGHQYKERTKDLPEFERELWRIVEPTANLFAEKLQEGGAAAAFATLVSRAAMNPDVMRFFNARDDLMEAEEFATALGKREVPPSVLVGLLAIHVRQMEAARGKLESSVERWKDEFLDATKGAVKDGYLSARTNLESVERRLFELPIIGFDPFLTGEHDAGGVYGALLVRINLYSTMSEQRHTFFHEGAHGIISGRQEVEEISNKSGQSGLEYGVRKSGLSLFSYRANDKKTQRRLGWMDEAVSEEVAGYLSGDGPQSYPKERELLVSLREEGLPHLVVMDAYQEDLPNEPRKGVVRLPALRDLFSEIYKRRTKDWLREQDEFFERRMAERAVG